MHCITINFINKKRELIIANKLPESWEGIVTIEGIHGDLIINMANVTSIGVDYV